MTTAHTTTVTLIGFAIWMVIGLIGFAVGIVIGAKLERASRSTGPKHLMALHDEARQTLLAGEFKSRLGQRAQSFARCGFSFEDAMKAAWTQYPEERGNIRRPYPNESN